MPRGARIGQAAGEQQAQVLLRRDDRSRLLASASGAMITSVKIFDDLGRGFARRACG